MITWDMCAIRQGRTSRPASPNTPPRLPMTAIAIGNVFCEDLFIQNMNENKLFLFSVAS